METRKEHESLGRAAKAFIVSVTALSMLIYLLLRVSGGRSGTEATLLTIGGTIALVALACPMLPAWGPSGFRTPWVYASRRAWVLTQRVAAAVFSVFGVAVILASLQSVGLGVVVLTAGGAICVLGVGAFSWAVWAGDENR